MTTKTLKYAFAIFLTLALIVLLRAYLHQPDHEQVEISEPIIFDETKSINNLSSQYSLKPYLIPIMKNLITMSFKDSFLGSKKNIFKFLKI